MKVPEEIERYRIKKGSLASDKNYGPNGAFRIPGPNKATLNIIVSDGYGWEHASVSVHKKHRTPTWEEMCFVKDLFWDAEEEAIQYHPRRSEYVDCHPGTLHMWRPVKVEILMPPGYLVGPK